MFAFENKVAIVTGSSSGIGRAAAVAFARSGARVIVADIQEQGGQQTVQLVKDVGGDGMFVHTDVSREADVAALMDTTVETYGRPKSISKRILALFFGVWTTPVPIQWRA